MYRRAVLIYNPAAGRRQAQRARQVAEAVDALHAAVDGIEAWPTPGPNSAGELAREARRQGAGLVIACGGDGTINEVVNGLAHCDVPLAVLPAGTANVLARELELPRDPAQAARGLAELVPRRIALGRVHCEGAAPVTRYFLSMCGAGLDARIVYQLSLGFKARLGMGAYWLAGFGQLARRLDVFEARVNGRRFECTFLLASHLRYYGGNLRITRRAHLMADTLSVAAFTSRSSLRYVRYLVGVLTGGLDGLADVARLDTRSVELKVSGGARVGVQVDGEYAGRLPARIEMADDALTLLVPRSYAAAHEAHG